MEILFTSWSSVGSVLFSALLAYPTLVIVLRIAGKRSLSKLNMFDFIITVAIGSIFSAIIIYQSITFVDGALAIFILLLGQAGLSWLSIRSKNIESVVKPRPTLVYDDEHGFKEDSMKSVRLTKAEILAAVRQSGIACLTDVYAVVLETNGVISVIGHKDGDIDDPSLEDVAYYELEK